jgi:hypothetical protein
MVEIEPNPSRSKAFQEAMKRGANALREIKNDLKNIVWQKPISVIANYESNGNVWVGALYSGTAEVSAETFKKTKKKTGKERALRRFRIRRGLATYNALSLRGAGVLLAATTGAVVAKELKDRSISKAAGIAVGGAFLAGVAEVGSEECRQRVRLLREKEAKVKALPDSLTSILPSQPPAKQ